MEYNEEDLPNLYGELKKHKTSSISKLFGTTNLRHFEINFKKETFGYRINKTDKFYKAIHRFSEILEVSNDVPEMIRTKCDWKFALKIKVDNRDYIVFAPSKQEMDTWNNAFNKILKRIPDLPKISEKVFNTALSIFYYPYLNQIKSSIKIRDRESIRKKKKEENVDEDRKRKTKDYNDVQENKFQESKPDGVYYAPNKLKLDLDKGLD